MGVIGILGGMGPQATIDLYQKILNLTPAQRDQDHLQVLIWSDPQIPDRTAAILSGGVDPAPALVAGTRLLVQGGAGCLGMPCNTAHHYFSVIQEAAAGVEVLNMIELTAQTARRILPRDSRIAITATRATIATGLYSEAMKRVGLTPVLVDEDVQTIMDDLIFGPRGVKAGFLSDHNNQRYADACAILKEQGADMVVAACTELSLLTDQARDVVPILDPTLVLAQALVNWGLQRRL